MNTTSVVSYRFPQRLYPLNLLAQLKSRRANGCLRVVDGSTTWSIYLEDGDLVYASNSTDLFGRLDRHLNQVSRQAPSLVSAVRVQLRLLFENYANYQYDFTPDYQAICWLVEQQYLTSEQVPRLVDAIAKEVVEEFLLINHGSYELFEKERFDRWSAFCRLDLRNLVESCQQRLQQRKLQERSAAPAPPTNFNPTPPDRTRLFPGAFAANSTANPTAEPAPLAKPPGGASSPSSLKLSKQHYTVVCIDDSQTVLRSINAFLDDSIFSVVMLNDPVKALMQIVRSKPDLILLDVTMPNLDGYELCALLRRHPSFKAVPVVMVTGNTGFIDRAKAKLVGASSYLTKPFTQSDLLKTVFKHLS